MVAACLMVQVIAPAVRAYLYTWGGRKTAEGEKIPVRIEELDIGYIDGMLLLPLVVEHGIDERSPLYGHTYESLRVCMFNLCIHCIAKLGSCQVWPLWPPSVCWPLYQLLMKLPEKLVQHLQHLPGKWGKNSMLGELHMSGPLYCDKRAAL